MSATIHKLDFGAGITFKPILIPDGVYSLAYSYHQTWKFQGRIPKVIIHFAIQDFGDYFGQDIVAFYNAKKLTGKPKKDGHFSAGWRSKFMFDYSLCFETPKRTDRFSMCRFRNVLISAKTRTVTHNRDQREYPKGLRYSIVDKILEAKPI